MKSKFATELKMLAVGACWVLVMLILFGGAAFADDDRPNRGKSNGTDISQTQTNRQAQAQEQTAAAQSNASASAANKTSVNTTAHGGEGGDATASGGSATANGGSASSDATGGNAVALSEGSTASGGDAVSDSSATTGDISIEGDRVENNSTNVVLVPNNNTSGCTRVLGLSFGKDGAAGGLGIPQRDKACDFEQAADDAAAIGEHKIAWWWRCHKPTLYKTFSADSKELQILACWNSMVEMMMPEPAAAEPAHSDPGEQHIELEQYETQLAQIEDRFAQQTNLINSLLQERDDKEAEIERLKRQTADIQRKDQARRAAALELLTKEKK